MNDLAPRSTSTAAPRSTAQHQHRSTAVWQAGRQWQGRQTRRAGLANRHHPESPCRCTGTGRPPPGRVPPRSGYEKRVREAAIPVYPLEARATKATSDEGEACLCCRAATPTRSIWFLRSGAMNHPGVALFASRHAAWLEPTLK